MKPTLLKNNLPAYFIDTPGTDALTVLVLVGVGSRYESPELSGASHYIEHMMFKGTKRRPKAEQIAMALDAVGAQYNAYTGQDVTGYWVKVPKKHAKLAIDLLHDMLTGSLFASAEMAREKKVIMEEINMYEDSPMMHVEELLEAAMFPNSTLGWNIAGTHETMTNMKRKNVIAFRDAHYVASNMVVALAGSIPREARTLVEKKFGRIKKGGETPGFEEWGGFESKRKVRSKRQYKETNQVQIMLGFPGIAYGHKDEAAAKLLAVILGGSMSSRLFLSVRERKGLCYFIRARHGNYQDTGLFTIQSGLDKSRLPLAGKTIMKELRKIKKEKVSAAELKRAKDYLIGTSTLGLENSSSQASWYAKQQLYRGRASSPKSVFKKFDKVTTADIHRVANQIFDQSKMGIAGIGPFKTDASITKHFN